MSSKALQLLQVIEDDPTYSRILEQCSKRRKCHECRTLERYTMYGDSFRDLFEYPWKRWRFFIDDHCGTNRYGYQPVGINTLNKSMTEIAEKGSLQGSFTNRSGKRTCETTIYTAGIDEQEIMERTGHSIYCASS